MLEFTTSTTLLGPAAMLTSGVPHVPHPVASSVPFTVTPRSFTTGAAATLADDSVAFRGFGRGAVAAAAAFAAAYSAAGIVGWNRAGLLKRAAAALLSRAAASERTVGAPAEIVPTTRGVPGA